MQTTIEDIVHVAEQARRIGLCERTARMWCARGYVTGARLVGRDWIAPMGSIEQVAKQRGAKLNKA